MTRSLSPWGLAATLFMYACGSEPTPPPPPPPPPPPAPAAQPAPVAAEETPPPASEHPHHHTGKAGAENHEPEHHTGESKAEAEPHEGAEKSKGGDSLYDLAKRGEATLPTPPKAKTEAAAGSKVPPKAAAPALPPAPAPTPVAPPKPASKVVVPSTQHVHIDLPGALQTELDADPRMQPWVKQVVSVADKCYAQQRKESPDLSGIIEVRLTMHENERPDANPKVPGPLAGIVGCATGQLMSVKMPLFTGKEGERHTVKIHFDK